MKACWRNPSTVDGRRQLRLGAGANLDDEKTTVNGLSSTASEGCPKYADGRVYVEEEHYQEVVVALRDGAIESAGGWPMK